MFCSKKKKHPRNDYANLTKVSCHTSGFKFFKAHEVVLCANHIGISPHFSIKCLGWLDKGQPPIITVSPTDNLPCAAGHLLSDARLTMAT